MSADNGYSVRRNRGKYLVHYWAEDGGGGYEVLRNKHFSALAALVNAHDLNYEDRTEYGVTCSREVIDDAKKELEG